MLKPTSNKPHLPTQPSMKAIDHGAILARRLDLLAGCELQHGHRLAAERLARQAAELREAAR